MLGADLADSMTSTKVFPPHHHHHRHYHCHHHKMGSDLRNSDSILELLGSTRTGSENDSQLVSVMTSFLVCGFCIEESMDACPQKCSSNARQGCKAIGLPSTPNPLNNLQVFRIARDSLSARLVLPTAWTQVSPLGKPRCPSEAMSTSYLDSAGRAQSTPSLLFARTSLLDPGGCTRETPCWLPCSSKLPQKQETARP